MALLYIYVDKITVIRPSSQWRFIYQLKLTSENHHKLILVMFSIIFPKCKFFRDIFIQVNTYCRIETIHFFKKKEKGRKYNPASELMAESLPPVRTLVIATFFTLLHSTCNITVNTQNKQLTSILSRLYRYSRPLGMNRINLWE